MSRRDDGRDDLHPALVPPRWLAPLRWPLTAAAPAASVCLAGIVVRTAPDQDATTATWVLGGVLVLLILCVAAWVARADEVSRRTGGGQA